MDNVLLITGASSDIGCALIMRMSSKYDYIYAHCNQSFERIERISADVRSQIIPVRANFNDISSVSEMVDSILESGMIPNHIVFLASPPAINTRFHKSRWDDFEKAINVSLRSEIIILNRLIKRIKEGKIVFMLTSYTIGVPPKYQSPYIVAKYAQLGLARCLAAEYSSKGICINAVSPDMIDTRFLNYVPYPIVEENAKNNPKGRNLVVDEVVPTIEFLLSDNATAISGQNIGITWGGELSR